MYTEKVNQLFEQMNGIIESLQYDIKVPEKHSFYIDWVSDGQDVAMEDVFCGIEEGGWIMGCGEWTNDFDECSSIAPNELSFESLAKITDRIIMMEDLDEDCFSDRVKNMRYSLLELFHNSDKELTLSEPAMVQYCDDEGDSWTEYAISVKDGEIGIVKAIDFPMTPRYISPDILDIDSLARVADSALATELGDEE